MDKVSIEILNSSSVFTLREVCQRCGIAAEQVIEFVDFGIAEPAGDNYQEWCFSPSQLFRLTRALRLQRDLEINLPGLALAMDLLEEIDSMRLELETLRQQAEVNVSK